MYRPIHPRFRVYFGLHRRSLTQSSHLSHLSPVTSRVVGAPQVTLQRYVSTFPCISLPSGNLQIPFQSISFYLPISSSVFISFLFLSLLLAELSSPTQRIMRYDHTIRVSVFSMLRKSPCTPVALWILLRTSSFVKTSL